MGGAELIGRTRGRGLDRGAERRTPMAYFTTRPENGRHFLQIPGPTNVPDRVLRALDNPTMDHRGPDFGLLGKRVLEKVKPVFGTEGPVVIYPSSGTGAWEAALVNTLSPGDAVLMCETGWFAHLWQEMAERLSLKPGSSRPTGARRPTCPPSRRRCARTRGTRSRPSASSTTRRARAAPRRIDEVRRAMDARRPPRAADRRHHLLPRLGRVPARRVARRRHGCRAARRG